MTQTSRPAIDSRRAAASPATPAPITTTSVFEGMSDMGVTLLPECASRFQCLDLGRQILSREALAE